MWTKANIGDQSGKVVIVTGANSGIGFETARALYEAGATVTVACRDHAKAQTAISEIQKQPGKGHLEPDILDLADLESVKEFASTFKQKHARLDVLINNAGIFAPPVSKSREGYELQFAVNFIGTFALTAHLYPLLRKNSGARIVTVSSMAYLYATIDFDNLKSEKGYDPYREYGQSKLADLIFALELQKRITAQGDGVLSIAAQPGANATNLSRTMTEEEIQESIKRVGPLMPMAQGALSILYPAVSPEAFGGRLYGPDQDGGYRGYPAEAVIAPVATDEPIAQKLWTVAEEITRMKFL